MTKDQLRDLQNSLEYYKKENIRLEKDMLHLEQGLMKQISDLKVAVMKSHGATRRARGNIGYMFDMLTLNHTVQLILSPKIDTEN